MRPFRKEKMASTLRTVIGDLIGHRLNDPRISPLTSVTRVELSPDLMIAKVYISVLGGGGTERATLAALQHAICHVRRIVASRLQVRNCPEIVFSLDPLVRGVAETHRLIDESVQDDRQAAADRGEDESAEAEQDAELAEKAESHAETEKPESGHGVMDGVSE